MKQDKQDAADHMVCRLMILKPTSIIMFLIGCSLILTRSVSAALLGDGQQRKGVDVLGYLFSVADRKMTDLELVEKGNKLYESMGVGARDDSVAMNYLIHDWKFDNKRPCMVR